MRVYHARSTSNYGHIVLECAKEQKTHRGYTELTRVSACVNFIFFLAFVRLKIFLVLLTFIISSRLSYNMTLLFSSLHDYICIEGKLLYLQSTFCQEYHV